MSDIYRAAKRDQECNRLRARIDAELPTPCGDCRHWGGEPDSAKLGSCHVAGSFRAPGGLFTEADFGCIHGVKR